LVLVALAAGGPARSIEPPHRVELLPAATPPRSGSDPIQLDVSGVDTSAILYVLLDGQDVTEFGSIEGEILTLAFGVPLAGGAHEISLLRQLPDGGLAEEGTWSIEVQQSEHLESAGLGLDVTHNLWVRVADGGVSDLPGRGSSDGAAKLNGSLATRHVRLSGQAPLLWDTQEESFDGDNATVGNWLLEASTAPADLRIGHQEAATSTLALDSFNRRGLSLALRSERLRTEVTGFSVRGTPLVGFHEGLGVHDDSNRVSGVQIHTQLAESETAELSVTGVWLTGESPDGGGSIAGTVGDNSVMEGSSWGLQGFGALFGRRVQASGGYAATRFDFGVGDREDEAWSVEVVLEPFPNLSVHELPLSWTVTADTSKIGTDYASLGNPSLLPDRRTSALRSESAWAGFALNAFLGRIEDDVNNADELARSRADAWSLEFSFSPAELLGGERRGWLRWLGMPTLWGSYRYDRLKPVSSPAGFDTGLLANTRTDSGSAILAFQYDSWSWSVGHTLIDTDDRTPAGISSVIRTTELRADTALGDVALGIGLQLNTTDLDGPPDVSTLLVAFTMSTPLLTDRLRFTSDVSIDRGWDTADTEDRVGVVVNGAFDWTAIEAAQSHPGLVLSLLGSYQGLRDDVTSGLDQDAYQLYLRASLTWPVILGSL
jgi:hypothetical protein